MVVLLLYAFFLSAVAAVDISLSASGCAPEEVSGAFADHFTIRIDPNLMRANSSALYFLLTTSNQSKDAARHTWPSHTTTVAALNPALPAAEWEAVVTQVTGDECHSVVELRFNVTNGTRVEPASFEIRVEYTLDAYFCYGVTGEGLITELHVAGTPASAFCGHRQPVPCHTVRQLQWQQDFSAVELDSGDAGLREKPGVWAGAGILAVVIGVCLLFGAVWRRGIHRPHRL
jgi:hypothetical protein